jgi:hypothetical protein
MKDKMAAMRTLRSRAEEYCSTPQLLKQEINLLSQIFLDNGYPPHIVYSNFHKKTTPTNNTEPDPNNSEPDPMSKNFFAPYHPAAHRLFKTLKRKFAINTIHTSTPNLGNFLLKRRPPSHPLPKAGTVYAVPCECPSFYIGETKRTTAVRTAEEAAACAKFDRTQKLPINNDQYNDLGITYHHKETGHTFRFQDTVILANETNWFRRKLLEGFFITANKGNLVNLKGGTKTDNCWSPLLLESDFCIQPTT